MVTDFVLLVVDDDEVDRLAVRRALRSTGLTPTIREAADEEEALAALAAEPFDCILLDYQLGAGDGLTLLHRLREAQIRVPVVMLTGQGDESIAVEIMKAGAVDYLPKGRFTPDRLVQSLRHAVRVRQAEEEAERATTALRLLAETSVILAASLDYATTLTNVVRVPVPLFADLCSVQIRERGSESYHVGAFFTLPELEEIGQKLIDRHNLPSDLPIGTPRVLRTATADWIAPVTDEIRHAAARDAEHLAILQAINVTSFICVPLMARNQLLGTLSFTRTGSRPLYNSQDVALAQELGQRAAMAMDNALLYQEAQEAIRTRDAFISIASHELKTPLTTLYGHSEMLRRRFEKGAADPRDQRAIQIISDQGRRLNRMIESLLDFSRLEAGQLSIEQEPVELGALLARLTDEMRAMLNAHSLEYLPPDGPLTVVGDALRLEQVVQNLIQNAVKYSPHGGTITVQLQRSNGYARLHVADEGIGISEEAMPHLFTRFYRAPGDEVRQVSGIGVGLFVVHEIVSIHGGNVTVESDLGKGSTFTITLPLQPTPLLEEAG